MTRKAFENAIVTVMALGGSTNAVLHLLAMAHAVDVPLTLDDFQTISDRTPFIADLKPSGRYVMEDLHKVGRAGSVSACTVSRGLREGLRCMVASVMTPVMQDLPQVDIAFLSLWIQARHLVNVCEGICHTISHRILMLAAVPSLAP